MSREHASPRFVYRLVHGWVKKERGEIGVKEEKKQVCLTSSDIRGYIIKCYITVWLQSEACSSTLGLKASPVFD